jgi:hypothetical protein
VFFNERSGGREDRGEREEQSGNDGAEGFGDKAGAAPAKIQLRGSGEGCEATTRTRRTGLTTRSSKCTTTFPEMRFWSLESLFLRIFRNDSRVKLANVMFGSKVFKTLSKDKAWTDAD